VGRFILQDLLGQVSPRLGDTQSWAGNIIASGALVGAWGYFLYNGAIDPDGIAKSLWPIFGIANQLLAVIAFCLGTTVIIKMGRARYAWCTIIPLAYLATVTFSAGLIKIFAKAPLGFLDSAAGLQQKIADGGTEAQIAEWSRMMINNRVDAFVTGLFLVLVTVIVVGCVREWMFLLWGRKPVVLHETKFVPLVEPA
jgi:carbon starvation protein